MKTTLRIIGISLLISLISSSICIGTDSDSSAYKTDPVIIKSTLFPPSQPIVTGFHSTNKYRDDNTVLFGDHLLVAVKNLPVLLKQMDSLLTKSKAQSDTLYPILLFINGLPANDIKAYSINKIEGTVNFELKRKSATLSKFHYEWLWSVVQADISIGIKGHDAIPVDPKMPKVSFKYITYVSMIVVLCMVIAMLLTFNWLIKKTNLIRITDSQSKYSLGLTQLLFWVFLIALSFVYIWITTTEMYPITGSVLVLLTISLSTSGGARLVDKARDPSRIFQASSESFFKDILSDDIGYSVHRVQMAIWTLILGIIFVYEVIVKQQMPQFDNNLLLLMGISSTGYVGLKSIESIKSEIPKDIVQNAIAPKQDTPK